MRRYQVFNDSTKYWCDRNKKWKMAVKKKMMPLFWLHWFHAECDVCMVIRNRTGLVVRIWWNTAINKWLGKVVDIQQGNRIKCMIYKGTHLLNTKQHGYMYWSFIWKQHNQFMQNEAIAWKVNFHFSDIGHDQWYTRVAIPSCLLI